MTDEIDGERTVFHLRGPGCSATGERTMNGFLIHAGAVGRWASVPSMAVHYGATREELLAAGVLAADGDEIRLEQDYDFGSPSAAAAVMLGRNANGRSAWKHESGLTLGEFEEGKTPVSEQVFRRRWYEAHVERFVADVEAHTAGTARVDGFRASADYALELLEWLPGTGDLNGWHEGMKEWAVRPGTLAFNGFSGQMLVNQLVKRTEDPSALAQLLADCLAAPASEAEASAKIQALVDYVLSIRVGAHPAPGHVPFLLSYFWALADHDRWPVLWSSAAAFLEYSTGTALPDDPADRYRSYLTLVSELTSDHQEFEMTVRWWQDANPVFLDRVLVDRCAFGLDQKEGISDQRASERQANAKVLVSIAGYLGSQLVDSVSAVVGRTLGVHKPPVEWVEDWPRSDLWVDLRPKEVTSVAIRLWVNDRGATIAVRPALVRQGWRDEMVELLEHTDLPGCRVLGGKESRIGDDVGLYGYRGEFVYGPWFEPDELGDLDLREVAVATAATLQPLFDEIVGRVTGEVDEPAEDDQLGPLVAEFRESRSYPTPADDEDQADRRRFAEILAPDAIAVADVADLRQIWNTGRYGNPGQMPALNRSFRDASAAEYDRMIDALRDLCWGDDPDAQRIDRLLEDDDRRISGLGESVIMKLLAICHPDRYIPVYPFSGPRGKRQMLQLLEVDEPAGSSRGELQVASNAALRERLDSHFPGDSWGMTQFLYWYLERGRGAGPDGPDTDVLGELAEDLLVERDFLEDIVSLLKDKGQVILYGPPGTGKTYLARKLAEALAPDPVRRSLVQFHPSSSYEDFFEGYRPESTVDGEMTYQLTPGPLALLAERAADAPGKRHIMIIDEINRANLPKVLGELLFLLEYRGESVRTLYRPEDAFQLPKDLWFIGTMNTADRSIALVDAAMRRRFHFIPFFPNSGPMAGLLDRWLKENSEPAWVGELLAQVNDELEIALGGPHLQLGPSHFMKSGLDEAEMKKIWRYNIEPFIEDQFFGDRQQIDSFRFDAVYQRYNEQSGRAELEEIEQLEEAVAEDADETPPEPDQPQ